MCPISWNFTTGAEIKWSPVQLKGQCTVSPNKAKIRAAWHNIRMTCIPSSLLPAGHCCYVESPTRLPHRFQCHKPTMVPYGKFAYFSLFSFNKDESDTLVMTQNTILESPSFRVDLCIKRLSFQMKYSLAPTNCYRKISSWHILIS